jgi:putative ABC transport system permease protein
VSQIYLKLHNADDAPAVISDLKEKLPGYNIYSMAEFTSLFSISNIPGLSAFIRVIIGLAVTIGFLVVMLSMYTAILERTREIGILKSLGASHGYIVGIVIREVVALTLLGIGAGIVTSHGVRGVIQQYFPILTVSLHRDWWLYGGLIAIGGAILGSVYPAVRAARQDAIGALGYE